MKAIAENIISAFKTSSIRVKLVVGVAAFVLSVSTVCAMFNVQFAYRVTYNDKTVGFVATAEELSDVENVVLSKIKADNAKSYLGRSAVKLSLTVGRNISSTDSVATAILNNDKALVPVTVLTVDGQVAFAVSEGADYLTEVLNTRLDTFVTGDEDSVAFTKDVKAETGYFPSYDVSTLAEVSEYLKTLEVKTVKTLTYTEAIPYTTEKTESGSYLTGYKKVTQKGANGSKSVTAVVTYVNGAEAGREVLETKTLSEPVVQKELVGTAKIKKFSSTKKASGSMFIWPVKKVSGQFISSYWGDGRNHRAIDIACKSGTPIYAGLGGTVSYSGYKSDYGYHIIIDHGNGYQTVYAHANTLYAKKGDVVETGETIALVGSTGQSTGPHLHFEVRINGSRVDPMGYVSK